MTRMNEDISCQFLVPSQANKEAGRLIGLKYAKRPPFPHFCDAPDRNCFKMVQRIYFFYLMLI
jgi:hypothetical protein